MITGLEQNSFFVVFLFLFVRDENFRLQQRERRGEQGERERERQDDHAPGATEGRGATPGTGGPGP